MNDREFADLFARAELLRERGDKRGEGELIHRLYRAMEADTTHWLRLTRDMRAKVNQRWRELSEARARKHPLVGQQFHVDFQPYGPVDFIVERVTFRRYRDLDRKLRWTRDLCGRVVQGSVTSRLFTATHTRHMKPGEPYSLSGVTKREVLARSAVRVAM